MRTRSFVVNLVFTVALLVGGVIFTSCSAGSPTSPGQVAGGSTGGGSGSAPGQTHTLTLPDGRTFQVWISSMNPGKNTQLQMGQATTVKMLCSGPSGFTFLVLAGFSEGPGTKEDGWFKVAAGPYGNTSECNKERELSGVTLLAGAVNASTPNLPFVRLKVWVMNGEGRGAELTTAAIINNMPPTTVIDEQIGWATH